MRRYLTLSICLILLACGKNEKIPAAKTDSLPLKKASTLELPKVVNYPWTKKQLLGKVSYTTDSLYIRIPDSLTSKRGIYLHKDALAAYLRMYNYAKKDSIDLTILSAGRNFDYQKGIWERKWNRNIAKGITGIDNVKKILEYSSMPGTSRHHWGTEVDLNNLNNSYFAKGKGLREYNWLVANAISFGFCQTYSPKDTHRPHGYNEEKWHWSYLPISLEMTEAYEAKITYEDIKGFKGAEYAKDAQAKEHYVLGLNPKCE